MFRRSFQQTYFGVAMEDDITAQVQKLQNDVMGMGAVGTRAPAGSPKDAERDMNKTDDIFDLKKGKSTEDKKDTEENDTDNEEPPEGAKGDAGGEDTDTGDIGGEDTGDNPDEEGENPEEDTEDGMDSDTGDKNLQIFKKDTLKKNMIYFNHILDNNIQLLSESITNVNDPASIQVLNNVMRNLRDAKRVLIDEITTGLAVHEYAEVLKTYLTLRRVYDVSVETLDKHFRNIIPKNKRNRRV